MAMANPQPLQARPYEDHMQIPIQIHDDDADFEVDGGASAHDDAMDDVDDDHHHINSINPIDHTGVVVASRTSELTLAFEGEVYVFPAVTPEKVPAFRPQLYCFFILLLLIIVSFLSS